MEKHKFNIFPDMVDEEYQILLSDLKQNGYDSSQPIHLFQGNILDGWNRYKACLNLNIDPEYIEFEGTEVEAMQFVMRTNKRRNLTSSQWACIAVEAESIVKKIKEEAKERQGKRNDLNIVQQIVQSEKSDDTIAEMFNTNREYVRQAEKLKAENPEQFEKVKSGEKTIAKIKNEEKNYEQKREKIIPTERPADILEIDFAEELVSEMFDTIKRRFSKLTENQKNKAIDLLIIKLKEI